MDYNLYIKDIYAIYFYLIYAYIIYVNFAFITKGQKNKEGRGKFMSNYKTKKICTSIDPKILEALNKYADAHYISLAAATHLLLMEGMEMDSEKVDLNITFENELVLFGGNLPEKVLNDLNEYTEKHGFNKRQRYIPIGALLTATLTQKGYLKGE